MLLFAVSFFSFDRSYDSAARKRKSCVSSERSMSSADGPVLGITSSSASAMAIICFTDVLMGSACPSGVRSFQDGCGGGRQKSLSTDGAHGLHRRHVAPRLIVAATLFVYLPNRTHLWFRRKISRFIFKSKGKRSHHYLTLHENHTMSSSQEDELLSIVSHL